MDKINILSYVDDTLLKPCSTWENIYDLCGEAQEYQTASVCIPPCYVKRVRAAFPSLNICTVIGFPLGYATTAVKCFEAADAIKNGADELDMVVNLTDVKNQDFAAVTEEIREIKKTCGTKILKVIVEACYLTEEEKIALCRCVSQAKADYIKTSTGFGIGGATVEDVVLFKNNIDSDVKIKAAGGIRTAEELEKYISLGCDRIGASNAVKALED